VSLSVSASLLAALGAPSAWCWMPLWTVAPRLSEKGYGSLQPLSVFLDEGVVPRADRADNHNALGADLDGYQRVLPGDVIFNKLRTWQGGLGVARHEGIVSPAYFVCRPGPTAEPRFLHYLLRSAPYLAELARLSKWMPPSQFDIPWESLRRLPLLLPPLDEQRRIADFLDDQVSILDRATALRRATKALLTERLQALTDELGDGTFSRWGLDGQPDLVKASRILRVLPGYSFPSEEFTRDAGIPLLRGINVGVRQIDWNDCVAWEPNDQRVARAFALHGGDVVMGMDRPWIKGGLRIAQIGRVDLPALLLQRVACLRAGPEVDAAYVYWAYQSRRFREEVEGTLTGLSVPHLSGDQISSYRLFLPPLTMQRRIAKDLSLAGLHTADALSLADRQIRLLAERKASLISSAVTGEFDVTTARSVA